MTLNELIKLVDANQAQPMQPQQPQQPQPPKPTAVAQPFNAQQGQPTPQRNGYGYSRDTYKIPQQYAQHQNADGSLTKFNQQEYNDWQNNVKNWEAQRKADLEAQGIQLTDQNKHLWNHAAAWNYINQQRSAAQDTGRAWWKPWTWFQDAPEQFRQATNNWDPVEMEAAKAQSQGYQTGTQQDIMLNRAKAAQWSNNVTDKWLTNGNKYNSEFAQELRNMGMDPIEAGNFVLESNADYYGNNIPVIGQVAGAAKGTGDFLLHNSLENLAWGAGTEGAGLALTKGVGLLGRAVPAVVKATQAVGAVAQAYPRTAGAIRNVAEGAAIGFGVSAGDKYVNQMNPGLGLILGMNPHRAEEADLRARFGDDIVNAELRYAPLETADGSRLTYMDTESGGDNPANYKLFSDWANESGFGDRLDDPEVQKQWVQQAIADGTMADGIMLTPMFQNLSADDKAQAVTDMLTNRVKATGNTLGLAVDKYWKGRSNSEILAEAMRNDENGVLKNIMTTFLASSDTPTIMKFIENNMSDATGKGTGVDTSNLYDAFREGLVTNLASNPDQILGTMSALLKLQEAKSQDGADLGNSQGANAIKMAFAEALADPDVVNDMSEDNLMKLAEMFANNSNMAGGMEALGDKGMALANAAEENIRGRIREAFFNNPFKNGPQIAGLWLASKGFGGMGKFASNPWIFYSVAMSLLLGGALMLTSGIDDDDEEDDYHRALKENPWS